MGLGARKGAKRCVEWGHEGAWGGMVALGARKGPNGAVNGADGVTISPSDANGGVTCPSSLSNISGEFNGELGTRTLRAGSCCAGSASRYAPSTFPPTTAMSPEPMVPEAREPDDGSDLCRSEKGR